MILAPVLRQRFFDSNNSPLAGGKLYTYAAGTTTPLATYTDQGGGTPNANPVVLDASGYADVWIDPALAYKFILKDSSDVQQWSKDNVSGASTTGIEGWNATSNYSAGAIVSDSSGAGLLYVSLSDNNVGNALSNVTYWRMFGGKIRTVTANTTILVTDEFVRSNSTSGSLTHTLPACATSPIGKRITIKDVGTSTNTTSVKGAGTDQVDGAVTYATALVRYDSLTVENNGTSWDVVRGFSLHDGDVTTTKIADGAVTQAKLAARATGTTVAVGGVAISASSGAFVTTSTSYVAVTNLSVTITTSGRPVAVILQSDGSGSSAQLNNASGSTASGVQFLRGATVIGTYMAGSNTTDTALQAHVDVPVAGTYTYSIKVASPSGPFNTWAENLVLVAFEL